MRQRMALCLAFVSAIAVLATAAADRPVAAPFTKPDAESVAIELLSAPASYDRATHDEFTQLEAASRCSPTQARGIDVELRWAVKRPQVEAQRLDISMFRDGFQTGKYVTSGERGAAEHELLYQGAQPGMSYYWRVLTKTPEGWVVNGTGRFDTPTCPVDEVPE